MATKRCNCLLSKSNHQTQNCAILKSNTQFTNLNLNQNYDSTDIQLVHPNESESSNNSKSQKTAGSDESSRNSSSFFDKKGKPLPTIPSQYLNSYEEKNQKQFKEENGSNKSSNTLSLHIVAYENNNEAINFDSDLPTHETSGKNKRGFVKTWKDIRQHFGCGSKQTLFEIPRQQKEDEATEPEIMQFKASQKFLHPNQQTSSTKSEFEKLKEIANKLFQEEKFNEAIKCYTEVLQLSNLSHENQAVIYSNRSASNLMLGSKTSLKMAKMDAQKAIEFLPTWWKGYFRLARVHVVKKKWHKAEEMLNQALALNPESKAVRDEISFVRSKIFINTNKEYINPMKTEEEAINDVCSQFGISKEEYRGFEKFAESLSVTNDVIKGHQYQEGVNVPQDYKKAAECYQKAANQGDPEAMYHLGKLYQDGHGVKRDYDEALKWILKAANSKPRGTVDMKGICEAQHLLGLNYSEGVGVVKNYKKAAEWYEKAVQNGFIPSANNLGLLYKEGKGVEKSNLKAFNYFKFAAESGDTSGMLNLANLYFTGAGSAVTRLATPEEVAEGMKWLKLAADKKDIRAIKELKKQQMNDNLSSEMEIRRAWKEQVKQNMAKESAVLKDPLNEEQFGKVVEEAARKGSVTAQQHMEIWENLASALNAFKKNDSGGLVAALSKAIRLNPRIVRVPHFYKPLIEERIKSHPNEPNTITCYIQMNQNMAEYIVESYKKYPDDEYLAQIAALCLCDSGNVKGALSLIEMVLKRHPKSLNLIYFRAYFLRKQVPKTEECIKAFDAFIAAAPEDNPYVPACYYYKAEYYTLTEDKQKFVHCYRAGLAAEKKQLPCFLPYDFVGKSVLALANAVFSAETAEFQNDKVHYLERIKSDPKRKLLLAENRGIIIAQAEGKPSLEFFSELFSKPPQTPSPPSWSSSLKKITFKDMDLTKDKIYDGCVLEVRIIDWAVTWSSCILTKIEDENGDVNRFAIYNWPKIGDKKRDTLEAIKVFRPNVKVSIANPYNRMNLGQNTIRVESPEYIKIDNSMIDKLCHVCGKEVKVLKCSGCQMSLYCSKECQKFDWIHLNHKGICTHLKNYSEMM